MAASGELEIRFRTSSFFLPKTKRRLRRRYVPGRDGLLLHLAGFYSSALGETFRTPRRLSLKLGRLVEPISCPLEATLIVMAMRVRDNLLTLTVL